MSMFSRLQYYLTSIPTILGQVENWPAVFLLLLGKRVVICLRNGCRFRVRSVMDVWIIKESQTTTHPSITFGVRSVMDVWIIKETCLDRQYERNGTRIEDGWVVVDIGAGLGDFAILIARENPRSRVYAYEPFPESYNLFHENIVLNGVQNVYAFQAAVGARRETLKLVTKGEAVQYTTTKGGCSEKLGSPSLDVEGMTLDDVFETNGIERCDFLKMDCEGCEFDVLLGASSAALERISRICLEYHDGFTEYTLADLINHLERNGFQTRVTPNPVHSYLGFLYAYRI